MIQTPIPTPYDIVPPPSGPITPSLTTWLALGILLALTAVYLYCRSRRPRARSVKKMLRLLCADLRTTIASSESPDLDRISRIARRIVSQFISRDLTGLSATETRRLASEFEEKTDDASKSIARVLALMSTIEELSYAPLQHQNSTELGKALSDLLSNMETHVRRYEPL